MFDDFDIIYSYSRKQSISDGVLVDVTEFAQNEVGFKIPVVLTSALYNGYIKNDEPGQSINGRLWDVLCLLHLKAKGCDKDTIFYDVIFQMTEEKQETVKLKAVIGPDDQGAACLTIMMSNED